MSIWIPTEFKNDTVFPVHVRSSSETKLFEAVALLKAVKDVVSPPRAIKRARGPTIINTNGISEKETVVDVSL